MDAMRDDIRDSFFFALGGHGRVGCNAPSVCCKGGNVVRHEALEMVRQCRLRGPNSAQQFVDRAIVT